MGNLVCKKCGVPLSYYTRFNEEPGKSCAFHEIDEMIFLDENQNKTIKLHHCRRCDNHGCCYHDFRFKFCVLGFCCN